MSLRMSLENEENETHSMNMSKRAVEYLTDLSHPSGVKSCFKLEMLPD